MSHLEAALLAVKHGVGALGVGGLRLLPPGEWEEGEGGGKRGRRSRGRRNMRSRRRRRRRKRRERC